MKRFVDLRGTDVEWNFAWFDTILEEFEVHDFVQAWNTWGEFLEDYLGDDLTRYERLVPEWVMDSEVPKSEDL